MDSSIPALFFEPFAPKSYVKPLDTPPRPIAYKSAAEKLMCQEMIRRRVRPYLAKYISSIQPEIHRHIYNTDLSEYTRELASAWRRHNEVNDVIDQFLYYQWITPLKDWSLEEWKIARKLFVIAIAVDHTKNIYSGGLKEKIELEAGRIRSHLRIEGDQLILLLNPASGTFYTLYRKEHLEYYLTNQTGDYKNEQLKRRLLQIYHCGDEELLSLRLERMKFKTISEAKLRLDLAKQTAEINEFRTKKLYFMLERPDAQLLDKLLEYDNVNEYIWSYSFRGFPDLFLREEIAQRLKIAHRIPLESDVLAIDPHQLLTIVDDYIGHRQKRYSIRLQPYLQHDNTCGTCCILPFLAKRGLTLSRSVEYTIWKKIGKPYNFPGGMAKFLIEYGFMVHYYQYPAQPFSPEHEDIRFITPFMREKIEEYIALHHEAVATGMQVTIRNWDYQDIIEQLQRGNPSILGIKLNNILHWIIARGYRGKRLNIIDPLNKIKTIHQDDLEQLVTTSMGKRLIVIEKFPNNFFDEIQGQLSKAQDCHQ